MKVEDEVIEFLRLFPELTPLEIEEFSEVLQDKGMLTKKGDRLKHLFWTIFWKKNE